jgi:threonine/homoserine/homoserine lactone efflux protein
MMALMVGLIIGFLMCIPVGPINVWVVNTLVKHNFRSAFSIALGGSTMDFVYFMVILSGLSLFHFSPSTVLTLKVVGVLFLFAFGMKELLVKKQNFTLSDAEEKKTPKATGFFFLGVLIYSSNPTLIATMSGLAAVIKSWKLFSYTFFNYFALSLGLALGSAAWFYVLLKIVNKYQNKIPEKFFINFSRACGALIVLFSLYMAFNVYKENFV